MRYVTVILFFVCSITLKAQENLVPNPSFEETIGCPNNTGQIAAAEPWVSVYGSPDYYHECGTNGFGIPISWEGGGYANSGQAYAGIAIWYSGGIAFREFVGIELTNALIPAKNYKVEFYISMADSMWYATRNIGAYFSLGQPPNNANTLASKIPQVKYQGGDFLIEKIGWTKIEGNFIANGGESFLTIGNFDVNTDTVFVPGGGVLLPNPDYWKTPYYYIDDVSVILDTTIGIMEIEKQNIKIFPNPTTSEITVFGYSPSYLKLVNTVGQTVAESTSNKVSVAHLSQGLYVLQLFDAKGQQVKTEKVIVAH
jgi:OOP family OmpA-OmpF porin